MYWFIDAISKINVCPYILQDKCTSAWRKAVQHMGLLLSKIYVISLDVYDDTYHMYIYGEKKRFF